MILFRDGMFLNWVCCDVTYHRMCCYGKINEIATRKCVPVCDGDGCNDDDDGSKEGMISKKIVEIGFLPLQSN